LWFERVRFYDQSFSTTRVFAPDAAFEASVKSSRESELLALQFQQFQVTSRKSHELTVLLAEKRRHILDDGGMPSVATLSAGFCNRLASWPRAAPQYSPLVDSLFYSNWQFPLPALR
jgi:hypothetical protein